MAALRKTLSLRLAHLTKICPSSSSFTAAGDAVSASDPFLLHRLLPGNGDFGRSVRRFSIFQKRPIFQPAPLPLDLSTLPIDVPPRFLPPPVATVDGTSLMAEEVRTKVLQTRWVEVARVRLRAAGSTFVSRTEFLRICCEAAGDEEQGTGVARSLDESGVVIVWGNAVLVRPEEVAQAIENMVLKTFNPQKDQIRDELRKMEEKMAEIDWQAASQVRRELLWGGVGFLVVHTAAFTGLAFKVVKWDLLEPICYYVTSICFLAGYGFFLWTSKDPSFEGIYKRRFVANQKRLIEAQKFDMDRLNELRKACLH